MTQVTSRQRMLAALTHREADYLPCCFMSFSALRQRHDEDRYAVALAERAMGLDPMHLGQPTFQDPASDWHGQATWQDPLAQDPMQQFQDPTSGWQQQATWQDPLAQDPMQQFQDPMSGWQQQQSTWEDPFQFVQPWQADMPQGYSWVREPPPPDAGPLLDFAKGQLMGAVSQLLPPEFDGILEDKTRHDVAEAWHDYDHGVFLHDPLDAFGALGTEYGGVLALAGIGPQLPFAFAAAEIYRDWTMWAFDNNMAQINEWGAQSNFEMYRMTGDLDALGSAVLATAPMLTARDFNQWDDPTQPLTLQHDLTPMGDFLGHWESTTTRNPLADDSLVRDLGNDTFTQHSVLDGMVDGYLIHAEELLTTPNPFSYVEQHHHYLKQTWEITLLEPRHEVVPRGVLLTVEDLAGSSHNETWDLRELAASSLPSDAFTPSGGYESALQQEVPEIGLNAPLAAISALEPDSFGPGTAGFESHDAFSAQSFMDMRAFEEMARPFMETPEVSGFEHHATPAFDPSPTPAFDNSMASPPGGFDHGFTQGHDALTTQWIDSWQTPQTQAIEAIQSHTLETFHSQSIDSWQSMHSEAIQNLNNLHQSYNQSMESLHMAPQPMPQLNSGFNSGFNSGSQSPGFSAPYSPPPSMPSASDFLP